MNPSFLSYDLSYLGAIWEPGILGVRTVRPTGAARNLYPIMEDYPASAVVKRIFPQQACSAAYCWTCYLGCIIYDPWCLGCPNLTELLTSWDM